jgi:glucose-6-phosphate isomerase
MGSAMFETFNLRPFEDDIRSSLEQAGREKIIRRLWKKDFTLWKEEDREISNRLGWLEAPEQAGPNQALWEELADTIRRGGITDVLLLGMGGSSLAPEVFSRVFGSAPGYPSLSVLDSTAPEAVRRFRDSLAPDRTMFVVSSKSGTTIETVSFFKFFFSWLEQVLGPGRAAQHFLAITDPGTPLEEVGRRLGFLKVVPGVPTIGGRFSVFSAFGLLPAALIGLDIKDLVNRGREMARLCRTENPPQQNPGLLLGTLLGRLAGRGLDKLTFLLPSPLESFGGWLEQLIAESTGKEGRGILPVAGEAPASAQVYGQDRFFVAYRLKGDDSAGAVIDTVKRVGRPGLVIDLHSPAELAGQFYLWEMATAVAGCWLRVNPFEQPNVTAAKKNTDRMLKFFGEHGHFPPETPLFREEGLSLFGDAQGSSPAEAIRHFVAQGRPGDYIALLAFLTPEPATEAALKEIGRTLRDKTRLAVTFGFGPRYLHSIGQFYKGDAGRGLFLQFTARDSQDLSLPREAGAGALSPYSFGLLKDAQAGGDFQALREAGRKVIRIHLNGTPADGLRRLADWLRE